MNRIKRRGYIPYGYIIEKTSKREKLTEIKQKSEAKQIQA